MRKAEVTVLESKDGTVTIEDIEAKFITAVPYHQMQARAEEVSSKEIATALERKKKPYKPGQYHPWKSARRGFSEFAERIVSM